MTGRWRYKRDMWLTFRYAKSISVDYLNQIHYFSIKLLPHCPHLPGWTSFQAQYTFKIEEGPGIEPATSCQTRWPMMRYIHKIMLPSQQDVKPLICSSSMEIYMRRKERFGSSPQKKGGCEWCITSTCDTEGCHTLHSLQDRGLYCLAIISNRLQYPFSSLLSF